MPTATHHSDIRYADGLLTVSANNAGLNSLIHESARRTGMHVTGSVADDRVFGTYGPANPARVLSMLLDGTGTNLVIVQDAAELPRELILTARTGGVTPPNPNAAAQNDADDSSAEDGVTPPQQPMRRNAPARSMLPTNAPGYAPPSNLPSPQQQVGGQDQNPSAATGAPSSTEQPVVFPRVDVNTPPSTASSSPAVNTDSVQQDTKTPQQIFEELQRLRQQQPTPTTPQ